MSVSLGLKTHPERLVLALAVASWAWMLGRAALDRRMSCCAPNPTVAEELGAWTGMVAAMMLPTTLESLRDVAARSYRDRRVRAVLAYALGYLAWWALLGAQTRAGRYADAVTTLDKLNGTFNAHLTLDGLAGDDRFAALVDKDEVKAWAAKQQPL